MTIRIGAVLRLVIGVTLCSLATAATSPTTVPVGALANKPQDVTRDDGKAAGKRSMAGSGHVVVFEAPSENAVLTAVKIHGARYGTPKAPEEDFSVWLCDAKGKVLREFTFPYDSFQRGDEKWVTLKLSEATSVPQKFMLIVGFNPTQTKGVYVSYDAKRDGDSRLGLPGDVGNKFSKGDWMIRAVVDQKK